MICKAYLIVANKGWKRKRKINKSDKKLGISDREWPKKKERKKEKEKMIQRVGQSGGAREGFVVIWCFSHPFPS